MLLPATHNLMHSFQKWFILVILFALRTVDAQLPECFPPFVRMPGPEEKIANRLIRQICYDQARFIPGDYTLSKGDTIQERVLGWLAGVGIPYQVQYPRIFISAPRHEAVFTNLLSHIWQDWNGDDLPDIAQKSDAWQIHEPYAGGVKMNGLYLDRTGILLRSDSIRLPVADSVTLSFLYQSSPGSSITAILKTPATSFIRDFSAPDTLTHEAEITLALRKGDESWCSIQLVSASSPQARTFLQGLTLRLPQSESFLVSAPDTLKVESFGLLNFRPDVIQKDPALGFSATLVSGPAWLNADEKGYIFGRATCPSDFYPAEIMYTGPENQKRTLKMVVEVFTPAQNLTPPPALVDAPATPLSVAPPAPVTETQSVGKSTGRHRKKKGNRSAPAQETIPKEGMSTPVYQASLIREESPSQHIRYSVQKDGYVSLTIVNQAGNAVRTLFRYQKYMKGLYNIFWDGHNDAGEALAGGEYECRLEFLPADGTAPHTESCRVLKVF